MRTFRFPVRPNGKRGYERNRKIPRRESFSERAHNRLYTCCARHRIAYPPLYLGPGSTIFDVSERSSLTRMIEEIFGKIVPVLFFFAGLVIALAVSVIFERFRR